MNQIDQLRAELRSIPKAMWNHPSDPLAPPNIQVENVQTLAHHDGDYISIEGEVVQPDPLLLEQELLKPMDRRITGASDSGGQGIDALAWYVSFHHELGKWGIFIPTSSLIYLEHSLFKSIKISPIEKRRIGFRLLVEHELFHFGADYMCAHWELLLSAPCWTAKTERLLEKRTYLELEEALANAYMLRVLEPTWSIGIWKAVRQFVGRQPRGYREAVSYIADSAYQNGLAELTKTCIGLHAVERNVSMTSGCFDYAAFFPGNPLIPKGNCPIHIIHDVSRIRIPDISVRFFQCIPNILETKDFLKDFKTMPEHIKKRWQRKKEQLKSSIPRHPEFENFKNVFSLRLGDNFRAHLRPVPGESHWEVLGIGTHTKMGHG